MPTFKPGDVVKRIGPTSNNEKVKKGHEYIIHKSNGPSVWLMNISGNWDTDYFELVAAAPVTSAPAKVVGVYAVGDVVVRVKKDSIPYPWIKQGHKYTIAKIDDCMVVFTEDPAEDKTWWNSKYFEHESLYAVPEEAPKPKGFEVGNTVVCVTDKYETMSPDHKGFFQKGQVGTVTITDSDGTIIQLNGVAWWFNWGDFKLADGTEQPVKVPKFVVYNKQPA